MGVESSSGYKPFPPFAEWAAQANGMAAFDSVAARFGDVAQELREQLRAEWTRTAAVDTNAIEGVFTSDRGFTYTVATMAHDWETKMADKGVHARPSFEAAMEGYNLALDVATTRTPLTEKFIRELHAVMMSNQDYFEVHTIAGKQKQFLPKGEYKTNENYLTRADGTVHYYASPEDTPGEMARLVYECSSTEFERAHPIVQASYIHYAFVSVHPFADGNGRVSRALASIFLYRATSVPLVIFDDQKQRCYDALEQADAGRFRPFIDFIEQRTVDIMLTALQRFQGDVADNDVEAALAELESQRPSDETAVRIADILFTLLEKATEPVAKSERVRVLLNRTASLVNSIEGGYELAAGVDGITLLLSSPNGQPRVMFSIGVYTGGEAPGAADYKAVTTCAVPLNSTTIADLDMYEHQVFPTISEHFNGYAAQWAQRVVAQAVRQFN